MRNSKIVYNAIRTPDGTIIESKNRHDYVEHLDKNGKTYMVDGGHDYLRRSAFSDAEDLTLYNDDPFEIVREHITRYNIFKSEDVKLCNMSDQWLDNLLDMLLDMSNMIPEMLSWYTVLIIKEKQYRVENEISITEDEEILIKANKLKEIIAKRPRY
jgi:hypothetical protein